MVKQKGMVAKSQVTEIVRRTSELVIPDHMTYDQAIDLIAARRDYEETVTSTFYDFPAFPWDGAVCANRVLTRMFGFANGTAPASKFGPSDPPKQIQVEVAPGEYETVPWGQITLPGGQFEGTIVLDSSRENGTLSFRVVVKAKRRCMPAIERVIAEIRKEINTASIYRGKTIRLSFRDDDGDQTDWPTVQFVRLTEGDRIVLNEDIQRQLDACLLVPLSRPGDLQAAGIPLRRGVLLGGPYGTGKTLAAHAAARAANAAGITFVILQDVRDMAAALRWGRHYARPAIAIFGEDIEVAMGDDRTVTANDILNTIDGVEAKNIEVVTIVTTNHIEKIGAAMLRPGRLDAIIEFAPPDPEAVVRLVRQYCGDAISPNADLTQVGHALAGAIPAVIAEAVRRAKLHQLALQRPGEPLRELSAEALLSSADSLRSQRRLLAEASERATGKDKTLQRDRARAVLHGIAEGLS